MFSLRYWIILVVLAVVWGASFLLIKTALVSFTWQQVACLRICISFFTMLIIGAKFLRTIPSKYWKFLLGVGLFGNGIPAFLFPLAQTHIDSSLSGILNSLTPLFTMVIGIFLFRQEPQLSKFKGVILGLFGAVLLSIFNSSSEISNDNRYAIFAVLATLCYGISANLIAHKLKELHPIAVSIGALTTITLPALVYLLLNLKLPQTISYSYNLSIVSVLALGIVSTAIANIYFVKLIHSTNATFGVTVTYLIPFVAILLGQLSGERVNWIHFIGISFILYGVYLTGKSKTN